MNIKGNVDTTHVEQAFIQAMCICILIFADICASVVTHRWTCIHTSLWFELPTTTGARAVRRGRFSHRNFCANFMLLFSVPASTRSVCGHPNSATVSMKYVHVWSARWFVVPTSNQSTNRENLEHITTNVITCIIQKCK